MKKRITKVNIKWEEVKMMKRFICLMGMMAMLVTFAAVANASPLYPEFFPGEVNLLSDNSAEYLLNRVVNNDGSISYVTDNGDTIIGAGDVLRGWFNVQTIEGQTSGVTNILGSAGVNELTGIFEIYISNVIDTMIPGPGRYVYQFEPSASFEAIYGTGALLALYEDSTPDYSRIFNAGVPAPDDMNGTVKEEALLATSSDGLLYMVLGFTGAGGTPQNSEGWAASSFTNDTAAVAAVPLPGNGGTVNFSLNLLVNNSGLTIDRARPSLFGADLVDMVGSASLLGLSGAETPADVFDNLDATIYVVPEPATISLLGFGLLGLGFYARKRVRK